MAIFESFKKRIYSTLRWSEQYTHTDMVYLARGGSWLTAGQIISTASGILLAIAFANLLPKEVYGIYKYVLAVAAILAIPTLSGMGTAITQAVARGFEGSFLPALKTQIRWGLLGSAGSLTVAGYYYLNGNNTLAIAFLIAAFFIPFADTFNQFDAVLSGKKLFAASTKYNSAIKVGGVAALIATIFLTDNLFLVLLAYFGAYTILRLIFLRRTLKKYPPNALIDPQTISYGKHSSLAAAFATVANYLDKLLLFHYLGPVNLAIYSFAIAPIEQSKVVFKSLPSLAMPKFAVQTFSEIKSKLYGRLLLLFALGAAAVLLYFFAAPLLYKLLFPSYLDSVRYSQIFALTLLPTLPHTLMSPILSSKLTLIPKKMLYLWNTPDLVLVASLFLLTAKFGIMGVIMSRIFSRTTVLLVDFIIWHKIQSAAAE